MDLNILMPLTLAFIIVSGLIIYNIKNEDKLWMATISIVMVGVITNLVLLLNGEGLSKGEVHYTMFSDFGIGFRVNSFGILFSIIACLLWLISIIGAKEYFKNKNKNLNRLYSSLLITLAGVLGVFYAADLFTLFVFFEMMSFASYVWVAHCQNEKSVKASNSYLAFAVIGGLAMLFGIFILFFLNSDISLVNLQTTFSGYKEEPLLMVSGALMFVGFGAKAGAFMLHDWLPQSYTAAPTPATALLSGVLSKAGLYGLIIVTIKILPFSKTWAMFILILSLCNMLYGAVFAFLSNDLKRTLAFSSLSQVGFILWGISLTTLLGEHNTFAAFGTVFHMINHSIIKVILFGCAGIIFVNTNSFDLNRIKGYGRNKPWLKGIFGISAMSLMGIPLLSGYVSKTLLHESVVEYIHFFHESVTMFRFMEGLFLLSGGFTFAYMLKLFICIFIQSPVGEENHNEGYATKKTLISLSVPCGLLVILGVVPNITFNKIGNSVAEFLNAHALNEDIAYFSFVNLKGAVISIGIGLILYFLVGKNTVIAKNGYRDPWNADFTIENKIYKPLLNALCFVLSFFARICDVLVDLFVWIVNRLFFKSVNVPKTFLNGEVIDEKRRVGAPHISYSLAYSLLLFGIGFIFTLIYLLAV